MDELEDLLSRAALTGARFRADLAERPVAQPTDLDALRKGFGETLPTEPCPPGQVLDELKRAAQPGLVGSAGPRYFGFVVGGALPAATAADVLAVGWDQNAFNWALSPAAATAEQVAGSWLKDLLAIPASASVGFVTGGQAANTVGLAAARHHLLAQAGWDVERDGLAGAPPVRIVASIERHATIDRSVRLLGFGTAAIQEVAADSNGAIDLDDLERALNAAPDTPPIVCLQAGNVNTGACDNLRAACELVHRHHGWAHVDGAFGLWAAANPSTRHLVDGVELADSWACDGHKWLNVPYDSGFAFCAHPETHAAAVSYTAAYLVGSGTPTTGPADFALESSRRARGFAVWAALRQLGRTGTAELIERNCTLAHRFADSLAQAGATIANQIVLNQVLVGFGDETKTDQLVEAIQNDGTCWMGATTWRGRRLIRISVSNYLTTEADVDRSVAVILRLAGRYRPASERGESET